MTTAAGVLPPAPCMTIALALTSIALYLFAAVLVGVRLTAPHGIGHMLRGGFAGAVAVAVLLHGVLLYHGIVSGRGLNLGFANAASLTAWVIVLCVLGAMLTRHLDNLGVFVLPLAAVAIGASLLLPAEHRMTERYGIGVDLHIVVSVLAYSVLSIAACQAVVLAFQERQLRLRRPARILRRLPPLQQQESVLFQLIGAGFFLLSLSLVSGVMFVENIFAQHLVHKTVLSIAAWLVFAVLLWGRWRHGWRGRTAIRWSLGGFFILMLAYFGSKLVLELILGRAWYPGA